MEARSLTQAALSRTQPRDINIGPNGAFRPVVFMPCGLVTAHGDKMAHGVYEPGVCGVISLHTELVCTLEKRATA